MKRIFLLAAFGAIIVGTLLFSFGAANTPQARRAAAKKAYVAGNFKDAYGDYSALAIDPNDDPMAVSEDLTQGISCLQQLGREDEVDEFREKTIAAHARNWRLLSTAGNTYLQGQSYGFIIAGKFYRGNHRGNDGRMVSSAERDRIRALQLYHQASELTAGENDKNALGEFYLEFASAFIDNRFGDGSWRLQDLSDLTKLPDYQDEYRYFNGQVRGAPVDEKGEPIYYITPPTFDAAQSDGQRWRWCLSRASAVSPLYQKKATFVFASFLDDQFGVQTMATYGFGRASLDADEAKRDESGPYAVSSLGEDETIARLASGIKRFHLPAEFNYIKLLQDLGDSGKEPPVESALNLLGQIFENRQQYDRAAEYWKKSIQLFGEGDNHWKKDRLDQILGNWGQFTMGPTLPAGAEPNLQFLFRNGKHVTFEAWDLDVDKLLNDVKAYIRTYPRQMDWNKIQVNDIGMRIVEQGQEKYRGKKVAQWEEDLQPREKHFDKLATIKPPLKKAGAYLIRSKMDDGNTSNIVLWLADTILVKKLTPDGAWCYVADAVSGKPIAKANVEFFGWGNRYQQSGALDIHVRDFAQFTDADGQTSLVIKNIDDIQQWLITARTPEGRMAFVGMTNIWLGNYTFDSQYNQRKVFVITDRPVYRPGQPVKFKFWVGQAQYDAKGNSPYAGQAFTAQIDNPRGEKVMEKTFLADGYGGFDGEFALPADATLGNYAIHLANEYSGAFRVEEYKKPEFEVKIDAPSEPVMLGETVTATISAKYYFGAPVTSAKVKYKVLRSSYSADWYPSGIWDWLYEPGYWWFAPNYDWYPNWRMWGTRCPRPIWWRGGYEQPEVISEAEAPIGKDGTLKIQIDSALAKAIHGDTDHKYDITAEVTDESRRTIVGAGSVLVARRPFKVYAWVDRGYYTVGDTIHADFSAQTLDNKPVKGKGELKLLAISYKDQKPVETEVQKWDLDTNDRGTASQAINASKPGQYRLSYTVTDDKGHRIEGGYVFVIRGEGFNGREFRFNDLELLTDKKEYRPGDSVKLMVNAQKDHGVIVLFVRANDGMVISPKVIRLDGKSTIEEIAVAQKDMPNFFVEGLIVSDGRVADEVREVIVPPESRVINVAVTPSAQKYRPGEPAKVQFKLTDTSGQPVTGSAVVSIYDKSVEYISGGSNVPEIKSFFWKWRRMHSPVYESNAERSDGPFVHSGQKMLQWLGVFGGGVLTDTGQDIDGLADRIGSENGQGLSLATSSPAGPQHAAAYRGGRMAFAKQAAAALGDDKELEKASLRAGDEAAPSQAQVVQPTVRKNFADTALWVANLVTDANGIANVELNMPENLTTWKTRVWSIGSGVRVGQGDADVVTFKNLIIRLQSPRFFVQKDQVVLSANVHNYLSEKKSVRVVLELEGPALGFAGGADTQTIEIEPNSEKRIDWTVTALKPGTAIVRMKALTDEESDATQMSFPVFIHGMLKTESFAGSMRPSDGSAHLAFNIPQERIPEQSRVELRYSPSVASAMVDALPYLVDYPYGCTEQTLNRFLPTVITQKVLLSMNLDLKDIAKKRTNLNAQEIGDDAQRAADWKRNNPPNPGVAERNPVFDVAEVQAMTAAGLERLTNMQCSDGGWGWFSGFGEQSWPHTTALVVHGLQIAKDNGVAIVPGVLERGVDWLKNYQAEQIKLLNNAAKKKDPWKEHADNLDALVYMVLGDAGIHEKQMDDYLYRDRVGLAVYAKALYGLALQKQGDADRLRMIVQNISQFVVQDEENQTAFLRLPQEDYWWSWYGSDTEAMAFYLKLLARTDPKGQVTERLAKYLINNRKHASYWNSTRDTAFCIEALADFIKASGEASPDQTVAISIDGRKLKEVHIDATNLFTFDNRLVLTGGDVTAGEHKIEFSKDGRGPLYFNAYVTNFTLEDPIKRAGLEIKVNRRFYKLERVDQTIKAEGSHGQSVDQKAEKYERHELADSATLKSGELVEVELEIDSKNDYEYVLFEDMKAAGFEPMELQSGYNGNDLNAYMELHDNRVCFFARGLARGKHSVAYRLRAEIPGRFSAPPTKASAMYAPELKANSDEMKIGVQD